MNIREVGDNSPYCGRVFRMIFGSRENLDAVASLCSAVGVKKYSPDDVVDVAVDGPLTIIRLNDNNVYIFETVISLNTIMFNERAVCVHNHYSQDKSKCRYFILYVGNQHYDRVCMDEFYPQSMSKMDSDEQASEDKFVLFTVLNINRGIDGGICEICGFLNDYMVLVDNVRDLVGKYELIGRGIDRAIDKCIDAHVLEEFLKNNRAVVKEYLRIQVELYEIGKKSYANGVLQERRECIDTLSETLGCPWYKAKEFLKIK